MTCRIIHPKNKIEEKSFLSFNTRNVPTIQQGHKITKKGKIDNRCAKGTITVSSSNFEEFADSIPDRSFRLWKHAIKSKITLLGYTKVLLSFTQKQVDNGLLSSQFAFDELAKLEKKVITEMCEDWIIEESKRVNPNTVPAYFFPVELFFNQNDVILNWKRLHKMFPQRIKAKNKKAYTQDDLTAMFNELKEIKHVKNKF